MIRLGTQHQAKSEKAGLRIKILTPGRSGVEHAKGRGKKKKKFELVVEECGEGIFTIGYPDDTVSKPRVPAGKGGRNLQRANLYIVYNVRNLGPPQGAIKHSSKSGHAVKIYQILVRKLGSRGIKDGIRLRH